jgi:hypothetical protein
LVVQSAWDSSDGDYQGYSFTGSGYASASIWIRGRFSAGCKVSFSQVGGNTDTVHLDDVDTSEWTKISLSVYSADWTTGLPTLKVDVSNSALATAEFEIGPTVVLGPSSQNAPEWTFDGSTTNASYTVAENYLYPDSGSVVFAFCWPDDIDFYYSRAFRSVSVGAILVIYGNGSLRWYYDGSNFDTSSFSPRKGEINTFCAVWSGGLISHYVNGEQTLSPTSRNVAYATSAADLIIGKGPDTGCWPLQPLSMRVDRKAWTADEVSWLDAGLRDPVANALSVMARGRKFRIAQVPSTPRLQAGGTAWIGQLVLEEQEYDPRFADITSKEAW